MVSALTASGTRLRLASRLAGHSDERSSACEKFRGRLTAEEEAVAYFVRSHIAHASAIRQNQMIDPPMAPLITPKKNRLPASYPATSGGS
jgi:hypothetical protein